MPRQTNAQGQTLDNWRRLIKSLLASIGEMPHLETSLGRLSALTELALELVREQRTLASRRQETSRRLQDLLVEGRRIADFLQTGIRAHYGTRSERLTEYGLQPFRGRKPAKPTEIVEAAAPSPASASETPDTL
jgi:hypothetical protein